MARGIESRIFDPLRKYANSAPPSPTSEGRQAQILCVFAPWPFAFCLLSAAVLALQVVCNPVDAVFDVAFAEVNDQAEF